MTVDKKKDEGFIKSRIDKDTKQEFSDIFSKNMSEKLISLITEAIYLEKEKFLPEIVSFFRTSNEPLESLDIVIEAFCMASLEFVENPRGNNILAQVQKAVRTENRALENMIVPMVYRDLINGLYKGKEKDSIVQRIERLHKNKEKIFEYIQLKIIVG